ALLAGGALFEMLAGLGNLVVRQHPVHVGLHHLLAFSTAAAHQFVTGFSASFCLRIRRPRWSRDMTVPTGMSRMWAAAAYENSPMSTSTMTSRKSWGTSARDSTTAFCERRSITRSSSGFSSESVDSSLL